MRTRILTAAAALVIGAAAATLAQRAEQPRPRKVPRVEATISLAAQTQVPAPTGDVKLPSSAPLPLPAEPGGVDVPPPPPMPAEPTPGPIDPAARPPTPMPAQEVPVPADPNEIASRFVKQARAEITRLEGEKREAEKELARAKARIRAAEVAIARWQSLAHAVANAMAKDGAPADGQDALLDLPSAAPHTEARIGDPPGEAQPQPAPVEAFPLEPSPTPK